ncbi:MAG: hypothetical protein SOZ29_06610 [Prevotella sp.]|nr:hypothetical protein [Prevotella sp.]
MKTEDNKRMEALAYIIADLKAENIEMTQRVHQLIDDYNEAVRQQHGVEMRKDEDSSKHTLDEMLKMRDHCDMLEKENRKLKDFEKAIHSFMKDKQIYMAKGRTASTIKTILMYAPHSVLNVNHAWASLKVLV